MKKYFKLLILLLISVIMFAPVMSEETYTLQAGVSIDKVPKAIFGSWRVNAKIVEASDYKLFKPKSTDLWNLSRVGNVLNLSNPFTGASADVSINAAQGNVVSFTRIVDFDNKKLTDSVTIRLNNNTFSGINDLKLEEFSLVDGHKMKSNTARYEISGEKISGDNVLR